MAAQNLIFDANEHAFFIKTAPGGKNDGAYFCFKTPSAAANSVMPSCALTR